MIRFIMYQIITGMLRFSKNIFLYDFVWIIWYDITVI